MRLLGGLKPAAAVAVAPLASVSVAGMRDESVPQDKQTNMTEMKRSMQTNAARLFGNAPFASRNYPGGGWSAES
jgi:hypothetical protein